MAAKRYSAGAIFLQVVPVFANVQRAIEDEAKNIDRALGDSMEKSGEKAGERAGKAASKKMGEELRKGSGAFEDDFRKTVDGINKSLGGIDAKRLSNSLRRELSEVKKELASLKDVDITADADFRRAYAAIAELEGRTRGLRDGVKIVFRSDIDDALRGFGKVAALRESIEDPVEIPVSVDYKGAERQLGAFEKNFKKTASNAAKHLSGSVSKEARKLADELKYLEKLRIGVDFSGNQANREIREIMHDLDRLAADSTDIDVKVEAAAARAEIAALAASLDKLEQDDVDIDVDSDGLRRAGRNADMSANSFRSFNIILLAVAGAGPALVPMLAALAGGLLALGPAAAVAGAGLGAVLIGFSGLGDALSALQSEQDQAGMNAQTNADRQQSAAQAIADAQRSLADAHRNAARAAEDAADRVADARESAADAIEDALERQREAQEAYRDSIQEVREAEDALAAARRAAQGQGADIKERISDNELAQDQALLDVFNQTVTFDSTMADGSATNAEQEQARINLEQARDRLADLRQEAKELAEEQRKWRKEGVNGTEEVQSAQENLNDAMDAQREAYEAVGDAAREVDQARADGAEMVREALQDQNETLADNRRAIADAQRALARAKQASADAATQMNSQQNAVATAFDKLGPAGRKFALFLFGMKQGFYEFRDSIQAVLLPAVQDAIQGFFGSKAAGFAERALINLARGFGQFVKQLSRSFRGEAWTGFFQMLARLGPDIQAAYGRAFISFLEAMASILTTLAPFALQFADGFAKMMDRFAAWAASPEGQNMLLKFLDYVREIGPTVLDFFKSFGGAVLNLMVALAPYGEVILGLIGALLDYIAQMDPKVLGAIVTAVLILITASQVAYAVMNLLMAGAALFTSTVGVWVFALIGIGLAVAYLYKTNEKFRDFMQKAWAKIKDAVVDAWNKHIKPALLELWDAFMNLWNEVLAPLFAWLAPIILWIALQIIPLLAKHIAFNVRLIAWIINNILVPVFKFVGKIVMWLWKNVIKPIWNAIKWAWDKLVRGMKWAWENILKPVFSAVAKIVRVLWKATLKGIFWLIQKGWEKLVDALKWTWEHRLKPVWDAIKTAAIWLWEKAGLKWVFGKIKNGWDLMVDGIKYAWKHWLKPVWDDIKDEALPALEKAFEGTMTVIKQIWNTLKGIVGTPLKFVLDTLINHGLIDGFNKIANWVGEDGFDHIPIPKAIQKYATGGVLPGYTPGRDVHAFVSPTAGRLELSGGEAIMRPEFTAAVGTGFVDTFNYLARTGGVNAVRRALGGGQAFARGGVFFPLPGGHTGTYPGHDGVDINVGSGSDDLGMPFYSATSGKVTTTGYSRGYGNAVFVMSPYGELVYGHSLDGSIRVRPGQAVRPGSYLAQVGNTGNSSAPHLHFGFPNGSYSAALALLSGAPVGKAGKPEPKHPPIPGGIMSILKNPLAAVKSWLVGPLSKAGEAIKESPIFQSAVKVPRLLAKKATDKIWDIVPGWAKTAAGWAGSAADWAVGGVRNAAGAVGDVAGHVGGAVADGAGAVGDFLGLKDGGILPYNGTMKYDSGGYLPPGLTSVVNLTGKPEPVFTNDQWAEMGGAGTGGNIHYEPHFEGSDLTAEDVAGDLNFTFRRIKRGGKYQGVGS